MHDFTYHVPTEIVFGRDAEKNTADLVKKYGGSRVVIVTGGHSAEKSGLLARMQKQLEDAGLATLSFPGAQPNPRLDHAREGVRQAIGFKADFVLAIGGGSSIDTGKAIAIGAAEPETDIWKFWTGEAKVGRHLPVGVVLTISAAGSETSNSAVLTNKETGMKRGLNIDQNRPAFAVMDPLLTMTLPLYQVTCGVVDIMMHTLDRYFNPVCDNRITDAIAEALLRTVIENGRIAFADKTDYEAMSELMWCGSLSHNGLTGLGGIGDFSAHQIGHELSARFDVAHGASLSAIWSSWARCACGSNTARFAQYARNVWGIAEADDEKAARAGIDATEAYFESIKMPVCFSQLGIGVQSEEMLAQMADGVTYHGARRIGTFYKIGAPEIAGVYRLANR